MKYNSWKLMDKIDVAIKTGNEKADFTGYIVDHGDIEALEKAKDWARYKEWDDKKKEYVITHEPEVHTFDNNGFTAKILKSAGGSSQGGRLSFWKCEIEKDGVKFTIGVNDSILADLIKSSNISNGVILQKVMFARQSGQPGLIHEGMDSYKEAIDDMAHKANMKSAKKTSKWEIGGVYSSITRTSVCLGEVWDTMEEYQALNENSWSYYRTVTKLRKTNNPKKVIAWVNLYKELPTTFTEFLNSELNKNYIYYYAGKPPSRAKTHQFDIINNDIELIDRLLASYNDGRYVRELK